jgi:hypothetical protein
MSTITELPTVNFDSYPGYDEFKFLHTTYSEEFKARSAIATQWGIVDTGYDPAAAPFSAGRPLLVTVSPVNSLTIDIASGYAITPSHLLVNINAIVPSVPLPSITSGKTYVIAVEYTLVASPQQRINRFGDLTEVRLERPSNIPPGGGSSTLIDAITVADIDDYNNAGIFSDERKQNIVVIAIVNVQSDTTTGQLYLSIDLTRNAYAFNRPWFTVRDVEHRSKIGSGVITDNNPHGVDLQDLSSAGLTLYQQLKPRGGILAKDVSYYGYAGKICTEEITLSRWEVDLTGEITTPPGEQPMGGRYFVRLTKLPVRTGSLYFVGTPWQPVPYQWIEGTRIIVLGSLENPTNYSGSLIMEYFTVDALEINAESPTQGLQFVQVKSPASTQEIIISGGLAVSSLTQDSLALPSLLGPIKRGYEIVCDGKGALVLNPQPILASVKVADLVGSTQTVNQATLNGSAVYLTIGLTRAIERTTINPTTSFDLDLKVQITGYDGNGTSRLEVLTFKGSQWKEQSTQNVEEPLQFLRTIYKYQLVSSIALANTLSEPHNAGPDATVSLWADALSGLSNQEFAPVASFFWTGTTGIEVKDERVIATSFDKLDQKKSRFPNEFPDANLASVQELFSVLLNPPLTNPATPARRLMLEMDDDRMWSETWKEFSTSWASGSISLIDLSLVTMGQTIRIAPAKYLKIVPPAATIVTAGVTTSGNPVVTGISNTANLLIGMSVTGTGIPLGATVVSVATNSVTLTANATASGNPTLTFKTTYTGANPAVGEVNYSTSVDIFRNNLIVTINDPTWDSTWWASLGAGTNPPLLLTREDAYPEGYVVNTRQKITFSSSFTAGAFQLKINGVTVGPVPYATSNNATITAIRDAITAAASLTDGVTAEIILPSLNTDPYSTLILNGNQDGDTFTLTNLLSSGGAPAGAVLAPLEAFTVVDPVGGKLPTPHLPQRYPNALTPWAYLSRPFLWEGVGLGATIQVLSNDPTYIGNMDAIEIAPSKVIYARAGAGATADPTIGQFLVDASSITNTFNNLAATVNHPVFASGVAASVVGNSVVLRSAGMAATTLRLLASTISTTWILTNVAGTTQYLPMGSGRGTAFLKTLKPLDVAEWRYVTVDDLALGWSPWMPLAPISPTAFTLAAPVGKSLYQIQLKLSSHAVNSFSLYDYIPEISGASLSALDARLTVIEGDMTDATGTCLSLDARISSVVTDAGVAIQDPELTATHTSVILPDSVSLKSRLDLMDTRLRYASFGGTTPHGVVTNLMSGMPPQLITGPVDANGNSKFMSESNPKVLVGGNSSYPLIAQVNGFTYKYIRQISLDFTGQTSGLYYVYLEESTAYGKSLATGTVSVIEGSSVLTDVSANFVTAGVQAGHLVSIPSILVGSDPLVMVVTAVATTYLTLSGRIPSTPLTPVAYTVYNPLEGTINYHTGSKVVGNSRLYLGEVNWSGSAVSAINYRYLNKYTSAVTSVSAVGGSYGPLTFDHNLGFIPSAFTIYYYYNTSDDPKVLHIGDEAWVKVTKYTMTIRNRYANLVARSFDGTAHDTGYLQLVI